jgi:hypothetical protein
MAVPAIKLGLVTLSPQLASLQNRFSRQLNSEAVQSPTVFSNL